MCGDGLVELESRVRGLRELEKNEDDEADVKLPDEFDDVEFIEFDNDKGSVVVCIDGIKLLFVLLLIMRLVVGDEDEDLEDFVDAVEPPLPPWHVQRIARVVCASDLRPMSAGHGWLPIVDRYLPSALYFWRCPRQCVDPPARSEHGSCVATL